MENIFDYLELGPIFKNTEKIENREIKRKIEDKYNTILN